jgi:phosphate transport system substrate-binding protein
MFCYERRDGIGRGLFKVRPYAITAYLVMTFFLLSGSVLCAADRSRTITIGGTGSAIAGIKEVATAFEKRHPDITIKIVPSIGSSGGINAVLAGALDLALSARPLTHQEKIKGASAIEYARTPFVFAAAHGGEGGVSLQQVASIYAGDIQAWPDHTPIRLVIRPEADTDTELLKAMSPAMEKAVQKALSRNGMLLALTDQENADLLEKVKGAFGTAALAQIMSEKRSLRALPLDGVTPSLTSLASGAYPYSKVFSVVTGTRSDPASRRFIEFLFTPEGKEILSRTGHLVLQSAR